MEIDHEELIGAYQWERYPILQPLGNREDLWLVKDSLSGKILVMRRLSPDKQEVMQTLAPINHPHIVHIADIFSYRQALYVVEEYLQGDTLASILEKKGTLGKKTFSVAEQLLSALSVLHQHHILHRDIKPENIMMDRLGNIVLIDFGIARLFSEEKENDTSLKGTKTYAPPEQFGFSQTDGRADIYALGVTLNELATGKLPEETIGKGALGSFIRRATEFDPKRRYSSAEQALAHLQWLKRRQTFFFLAIPAVLFSVLFFGGRTLYLHWHINTQETAAAASFTDYALPDGYIRRLLVGPYLPMYPAVRLENNESISFTEELWETPETTSAPLQASFTAEHTEEQFIFTCSLNPTSSSAEETTFTFTDSFYSAYGNNTAEKGYLPEYELLCGDFDYDGQKEFLILLSRCKWITPTLEEYSYYLTQYTCFWIVDLTENHEFICSEPLLIPDEHRPSLQNHFLIEDDWRQFYSYRDGKWTSSYLDGDIYYLKDGEWYLQE